MGTVFLCTYGGSKHGSNGCRRTYLSQRDLNAHIAHRHLKSEIKEGGNTAPKASAPTAPQMKTSMSAMSSAVPSHQALIDQFSAVVRHATATSAAIGQRPAPETVFMPGQAAGLPLGMAVSSSYPAGLTQPVYSSGNVMQSMASMSGAPPVMSQSQTTVSQESYTSAIPVLGSRIKTLISVPIQDDDYSKKHQPQAYPPSQPTASAMPNMNMNYPPPAFPVGSIAPNIHQPPPNVPPPMFSSQPLQPGLSASFTSPPPQILTAGLPRAQQRLTAPPTGPPRYFDNQQVPRGPWTGAPRGPSVQQHQPRGPPRADYNYY